MSPPVQNSNDAKMANLYFTLAVTFIIILLAYFLFRRSRKSLNVVVLTGLSDSGKTAIFSKVIFNKPKKSVTSLKESEATTSELNLKLIDLPGSDRLRNRYWEQYRTKARHVIFVLDSTTIDNKLRDLSEYLYILLSDEILYKNKIQFTVACNKQDLEKAKKKDEIEPLLEKELNAIRDTKKGQLGKTSNEEDDDHLAKLSEDELSFRALRVNLIETSVHNLEQLIKIIL